LHGIAKHVEVAHTGLSAEGLLEFNEEFT
jgi:hypothetical protein